MKNLGTREAQKKGTAQTSLKLCSNKHICAVLFFMSPLARCPSLRIYATTSLAPYHSSSIVLCGATIISASQSFTTACMQPSACCNNCYTAISQHSVASQQHAAAPPYGNSYLVPASSPSCNTMGIA